MLESLTPRQARGVQRIIEADLAGRGISSLLDCEGQICTSTTFYNRKSGWAHKAAFQQALALARRDYRSWLLERGGRDALAILAETGPDAARALRQQIVGDAEAIQSMVRSLRSEDPVVRIAAAVALGETELLAVVPALASALERETKADVRQALLVALGRVAGSRDSSRRAAVGNVLSRIGVEEAAKLRISEDEVDSAIERELGRLRAEAEAGTD